jgi:hypothetical protein
MLCKASSFWVRPEVSGSRWRCTSCFTVDPSPQGGLGRKLTVVHGSRLVPSPLKMLRQLGRMLPSLHPIARLRAQANRLMQLASAAYRHPIVDHLLIQRMAELVEAGHRAVGPLRQPA